MLALSHVAVESLVFIELLSLEVNVSRLVQLVALLWLLLHVVVDIDLASREVHILLEVHAPYIHRHQVLNASMNSVYYLQSSHSLQLPLRESLQPLTRRLHL